jgi:hypothetical protein
MGTSDSRPLELVYGEFHRALESGDIECALDLMAMAALAARSTPSQIERDRLRDLVRCGMLDFFCQDFRRDQDFENAALRFVVSAVSPLASALPADVGASKTRRQGWIRAWDHLRNCHPVASSSESIIQYSRAVHDYLGEGHLGTMSSVKPTELARLASEVEQNFADYSEAGLIQPSLIPADDDEEGAGNETRIVDELESFLECGEPVQALNLLAVCWCCAGWAWVEGQTISDLVVRSANLIRDTWSDSTETSELMSRLWVTAYSELTDQHKDEALEDLGLPGFEAELPPLSDDKQLILQSSLAAGEAWLNGWNDEDDDEDTADDDADEADSESPDNVDDSEDADDLDSLVPRSALVATALRHLERSVGSHPDSSFLSEASVDAAHKIWVTHATITASWNDLAPELAGYGRKIRAEIERWADTVSTQMYPPPADSRPTPQKRARRIYESTWAWMIAAGTLAVVARFYEGFWFAVGLGAFIGYQFSSNYDSITAPRLEPLPDPAAERRRKLQKALLEIGVHVALQYDSAMYASDLSASALRQLVNGAWQPQGPPPPRMPSCTPREAEYVAAQWMRYLGGTSCRVTQASRDGGMDIVSDTHVAEVKHHLSPVGVNFVRQIYGTATGAAKLAMFFSLSGYTRDAEDFANANSIALFRYDPADRTLTPKSRSALNALQHGLSAGMNLKKENRDVH